MIRMISARKIPYDHSYPFVIQIFIDQLIQCPQFFERTWRSMHPRLTQCTAGHDHVGLTPNKHNGPAVPCNASDGIGWLCESLTPWLATY
jgi:hypothetical protein